MKNDITKILRSPQRTTTHSYTRRPTRLGTIIERLFWIKPETLVKIERPLSSCRKVRQQDNFINNYSYERKA